MTTAAGNTTTPVELALSIQTCIRRLADLPFEELSHWAEAQYERQVVRCMALTAEEAAQDVHRLIEGLSHLHFGVRSDINRPSIHWFSCGNYTRHRANNFISSGLEVWDYRKPYNFSRVSAELHAFADAIPRLLFQMFGSWSRVDRTDPRIAVASGVDFRSSDFSDWFAATWGVNADTVIFLCDVTHQPLPAEDISNFLRTFEGFCRVWLCQVYPLHWVKGISFDVFHRSRCLLAKVHPSSMNAFMTMAGEFMTFNRDHQYFLRPRTQVKRTPLKKN
jgi:hypothetical protein